LKVDLHLHTYFSDGILDPVTLVKRANERSVTLLAITDHDCLDALPLALPVASSFGMTLVSGVEFNTEYEHQEVHILGYGFDTHNARMLEGLRNQREDRAHRFKKMLDKLNELGFPLHEKRVYELAGRGALGRPHLALALIEAKVVKTVDEAFRKYLGYGKPAWIPRHYWTPMQAIETLHEAGGYAALAHPERGGKKLLPTLVEAGLDGLEVFYPTHRKHVIDELIVLAKKYNLFATVGSDFHGINPGERGPGSVSAPRKDIEELVRILGNKPYG